MTKIDRLQTQILPDPFAFLELCSPGRSVQGVQNVYVFESHQEWPFVKNRQVKTCQSVKIQSWRNLLNTKKPYTAQLDRLQLKAQHLPHSQP